MLDDKLRVGVYGGTFAPVHNGHVESAIAFMKQMKLSIVRKKMEKINLFLRMS